MLQGSGRCAARPMVDAMTSADARASCRPGLENATVAVSGASRGIGRDIAIAFAECGARVVGLARTRRDLEALAAEISDAGGHCGIVVADLSEASSIKVAAQQVWDCFGHVDVLVNAAGMMVRNDDVSDITLEEWDATFALNVRGAFFLTQAIGRMMLDGAGGSVLNITSVAGEVVTKAAVPYMASKAALIHLTRSLAVRWAPRVRVNALGPAYVRTALNEAWLAEPENRRYVEERTPLGRVGTPADVTGAALFLSSPAAAYVTGQHLLVDGGWTAV